MSIYGNLALYQNDYQEAITYFKKALESSEKIGDFMSSLWNRKELALALVHQGDIEDAKELFHDCVLQIQKTNNLDLLAKTMESMASLFAKQEEPVRATLLIAWAGAMRQKIGSITWPVQRKFIDQDIAKIRTMIDETKFAELSAQGRAMTMEAAIALALEGLSK